MVEVKKILLEKRHPFMYNEVDIYENHVRVNGIERGEYFLKNYNEILQGNEYGFINTNEHLGKYVILLGLAGSYSYGTNIEGSDIDVRGITLNQKSDLIGLTRFEQYVDDNTDTVIYAFNKIITLLLSCNPNTIELLGLNLEHYLYLNDIGHMLLDNKKLFLSRRQSSHLVGMQMHSFEDCRMRWREIHFLRVKRSSIYLILLRMPCIVSIQAIRILKMEVLKSLLIRQ